MCNLISKRADKVQILAYLGKQRTLSFGAWPDVGLGDTRERRDEARKLVAEEWVAKQEREGVRDPGRILTVCLHRHC